jgi:hypothetical protein
MESLLARNPAGKAKESRVLGFVGILLSHRGFPLVLAFAAVLFMVPALPTGLFGDDLIQRLTQLKPAELPAHAVDTGFVANDPGKLGTVLRELFGYLHGKGAAARAVAYGIAPWWGAEDWQAALLRPVTAFTHWVDYRIFPNTPALMHAHSIAWYAATVFLAAYLYRRLWCFGPGTSSTMHVGTGNPRVVPRGILIAGLAGLLFLLDKNTYFPVMYVANRGFFVSLVFGLLCLDAHHRWRTTQSRRWMIGSALWLALSILSNEGGASTLAFLLAYALVLEPAGWRSRFLSLMPAGIVLVGWRIVYVSSGYGVRNFLLYIDPGYTPLLFLKNLVPRASGLLGGQLTGLPPEAVLGFAPKWQLIITAMFGCFSLVCGLVFWPILRQDRTARFWATAMLLAVVPASTVAPLTKNLAFVAVGAFGVMASFLVHMVAPENNMRMHSWVRASAWCVALGLVVAHIPAAVAARAGLALISPYIPAAAAQACAFPSSPDLGDRDVIVLNDPTIASAFVAFDRAYRQLPLPRTIRILVPGSVPILVTRPDAFTVILTAKNADLFDIVETKPVGLCRALKSANDLLFGQRTWKTGDPITGNGFVVQVLELSLRGSPRALAFRFEKPLDSSERVWLFFDWHRLKHARFVLPGIGGSTEIAGPKTAEG